MGIYMRGALVGRERMDCAEDAISSFFTDSPVYFFGVSVCAHVYIFIYDHDQPKKGC